MNFKLEPEKSALIVFDMINHFLMPGSPSESVRAREELVPRLKPLIAACRRNRVLVAYACQGSRADGSNLGLLREILAALGQKPCAAGTPATPSRSLRLTDANALARRWLAAPPRRSPSSTRSSPTKAAIR